MRTRLVSTTLICGALALSHSAQAATTTLDGKKVKSVTATFSPGAQDHDEEFVTGSTPLKTDRMACADSRCGKLPFVYKPAKGVKGDLVFSISWTTPGQDFDLYAVEYAKDGSVSQVATCGAFAGTSEKVVVPGSDLKPGKKYGLLVDYYRTMGDKVTATVSFPATAVLKSYPTDTAGLATGCGLS